MPHELKSTGQVTIVPCTEVLRPRLTIPIMGPTGAGKSTFIEALAGVGQSLGISKDQLEGFTQVVSCYKLDHAGVERNSGDIWPIYLIDTPGFSDSKISEMEIINQVKGWMNDHNISGINNILYLTPITDTRVPGSKRRTIKMLQSLLPKDSALCVTIVTTMWNTVFNEQATERAEIHFGQLGDNIWKDLVDQGTKVVRFQNDQGSAIDILRDALARTHGYPFHRIAISSSDRSAPLLYQELLDRISNSRQAIELLWMDHLELICHPDPLLESVVGPQLQEARQTLAKFLGQLVQFGKPPQGFEGVPQQVVYQDLLDRVKEAQAEKEALEARFRILLQEVDETIATYTQKIDEYTFDPRGYEKASQAILAGLPPPPAPPPTPPTPPTPSPLMSFELA